ncbi:MAG: chemotaxis protein CheW [Cellvibrionaceae bacterium]
MNEPIQLEDQNVHEVASLLIPLASCQLLVPTVTVAEMVPFQWPDHDAESPDWYLGDIFWREQPVPIVCYEVMNGEAMPAFSTMSRIAVLNNTGIDDSLPFIGIASQGIPRLSRVKDDEIHHQENAQIKTFDLMAVAHAGEEVIIPNVPALEQAFIDYKNAVK